MGPTRRITAPGRVNLIGDHTDYNRGVALPLAIDLGTTVELHRQRLPSPDLLLHPLPGGDRAPPRHAPGPGRPRHAGARLGPHGRLDDRHRPAGGRRGGEDRDHPPGRRRPVVQRRPVVALAEILGAAGSPADHRHLSSRSEIFAGVPVGEHGPPGVRRRAWPATPCSSTSHRGTPSVPIPGTPRSWWSTPASTGRSHHGLRRPGGRVRGGGGDHRPARPGRPRPTSKACGTPARAAGPARGGASAPGCARCADALRDGRPGRGRIASWPRATGAWPTTSRCPSPPSTSWSSAWRPSAGVYGARLTGAGFGGCVVALGRPGAVDLGRPFPTRRWRVVPLRRHRLRRPSGGRWAEPVGGSPAGGPPGRGRPPPVSIRSAGATAGSVGARESPVHHPSDRSVGAVPAHG